MNQLPYAQPTNALDIDRSTQSLRSNNNGPKQVKSRAPRMLNSNSPRDVDQSNNFYPKKFKEEDSFAAMQSTQLRTGRLDHKMQGDSASRHSRGSRGSRASKGS